VESRRLTAEQKEYLRSFSKSKKWTTKKASHIGSERLFN
jgi:hypothetical protein